MKGSVVALDTLGGRKLAAHMVDGKLEDLLIGAPDNHIRPGTIYRAKATRPLKGQGGMMLETPDGPVYLRQSKGLAPGDTLLVQVGTLAESGKAPVANPSLLFKSRYSMATPGREGANLSKAIKDEERRVELREVLSTLELPPGIGLILRTACEGASDDAIIDDALATLSLANSVMAEPQKGKIEKLIDGPDAWELAWREWPEPNLLDDASGSFDRHGVTEAIETLMTGQFFLPDGGSFLVEPTRALVAVDVNTGRDTSPASALKANIAALRALPRALRLMGLGGQIVVDVAASPKRDRKKLEDTAKAAFRADLIETSFVGWTPLGHMEFSRKRERVALKGLK